MEDKKEKYWGAFGENGCVDFLTREEFIERFGEEPKEEDALDYVDSGCHGKTKTKKKKTDKSLKSSMPGIERGIQAIMDEYGCSREEAIEIMEEGIQSARKPVKSSVDYEEDGSVSHNAYEISDFILEKFNSEDFISRDDFDSAFYEAVTNLGLNPDEVYDSDLESQVRGILGMNGFSTDFDDGNLLGNSRKPIKSANYNGFNLEVKPWTKSRNPYFATYPVWDTDLDTDIGAIEYHYDVENPYYVAWVYLDFGVNKTGRTKAFDTKEECLEWIGGELASGTTARDKLLKYWEEMSRHDYE